MPSPTRLLALVLVTALSSPAVSFAQEGEPEESGSLDVLHAHRITEGPGIRLDGRLEETVWDRATPISDFTQQEPREGAPPSEETRRRATWCVI